MKNQENDPQKLQSNQENDLQQQPPPEEPEEEKPHLQELRQQNHPISAPPIMASMISSPPPKPPPKPPSPRSDSPLDFTHSFDHSSYGYVFSPPEVKQATYHSPPLDHTSHSYVVSSPDVKPAKPPSPPSPPAEAPAPVSKVGSKTQDEEVVKPVEDGIGGGGGIKRRPKVSISERKRENIKRRALLGFRIFGFVFCLVSFSVMAADKNQGWALDSFYRYKEFRYCMSVNVIGFAYSALQSYDLAYSLATGKFVARNQLRFYLDFSLDQMLTYLLLSASSSAAFRVEDWESNWGNDKFPAMARSSVVLSFLAFVAFALSSLVSSHTLFTPKSM